MLPTKAKGPYIDVTELTDSERGRLGLSCEATIVEIIGTEENDFGLHDIEEAISYVKEKGLASFDLETDAKPEWAGDPEGGLDPFKSQIVLCQIGDEERQYIIWWNTLSPQTKEVIREWWANPQYRKVGVNLKFDARMLLANEGLHWRGDRLLDCQLLEQILGCGLFGDIGLTMKMTGMGPMAKRWLGWLLPKDEELRTGWGSMTPGVWPDKAKRYYAADDCVVPCLLVQKQAPWLQEFELLDTVKLEMSFLPVLTEMEIRGLPMDWELWEKLAHEAQEGYEKAQRELDELFDVEVTYRVDLLGETTITRDKNYSASDELKELIRDWMYENYGVEVVGNNRLFKEACIRGGLSETRAEKLFRSKLVPNPDKPGSKKQVGYPVMTDYIEGSPHVDSLWDSMKRYLPENSFPLPTTDSDHLRLLKILHEVPDEEIDDVPYFPTKLGLPPELVDPILDFRMYGTRLSRYAWSWKELLHPVTGRIHTDTTQCAADTGRLTTRPNFQNAPGIPIYRQAMCTARDPYLIVGADYSQIEPRITAQITGCAAYMRVFWSEESHDDPGFQYWCDGVTEPLDLYGAMGARMGILPPDAEKKSVAKSDDPDIVTGRKDSKIGVLSLTYGTGKNKFHVAYILDTGKYQRKVDSDRLYDTFWSEVAEVKATFNKLSDLAYPGDDVKRGSGYAQRKSRRSKWHPIVEDRVTWSESLGGRKRFFDKGSSQWWTQGRNHPIQSTGADILKAASVRLAQEWFWKYNIDGFILLTAHDEILMEVHKDEVEETKEVMERIMSEAGEYYCPNVPISAAAYSAEWWIKD